MYVYLYVIYIYCIGALIRWRNQTRSPCDIITLFSRVFYTFVESVSAARVDAIDVALAE